MSERDNHESYEVWAGRLHWIAAIIVGTLIAILWLMHGLAHTWLAPLPRIEHLQPPARPRLQAYPRLDLQTVLARERDALHEYRWVDEAHGIARIPIERAMDLIANAPPPERNDAQPPSNGAEPLRAKRGDNDGHDLEQAMPGELRAPGADAAAVAQRPRAMAGVAGTPAKGIARHAPPPPRDLDRRVGIEQRIGQVLPGDLVFHDTDGRDVRLAELDHGKPLVLAFGYFGCPNICDTQLHGMARTIASLPLRAGQDYQVAFLSIDPTETPTAAAAAAAKLTRELPASRANEWHLLTGNAPNIAALTSAAGVHYWLDPNLGQYVHPAGIIVTTGGAKVAQYFFGVSYPYEAVRLALVGASNGHLGTIIDQLVLLCCGYDPTTGRYSLLIGKVALIVCSGFLVLLLAWLWHLKRGAVRQ